MMTENIRKSIILITLALAGILGAWGITPQEAVDRFVRASGVPSRSMAVKITELPQREKRGENGMKTLAEHNATAPLVPASIMKSVTTAALLDEAGVGFRYHTDVYTDGPSDMGIMRGNIVIKGSGDPSLGSAVEPYGTDLIEEITAALKERGIHRIEGDILIDETAFAGRPRPDSWQQGDFNQSYGTGFHAFNFENNASGRKAVENPRAVFTARLKSHLRAAGINIDGKDIADGKRTLLLDHVSPPIDDIMRSCMMRSDNLFAESMLRTFGKLTGGDGSVEDAAKRATDRWTRRGLPMDGVTLIDGSGLSRNNRVTADFMTTVLRRMAGDLNYVSFFPLAGQDGTLKSFLVETPLEGYIAMKTGSMKGIQCYAGYLLDDDYNPTHTVVIIMNDLKGRDKAKKSAEQMLLSVFRSSTDSEHSGVAPDSGTENTDTDYDDPDLSEVLEMVTDSVAGK